MELKQVISALEKFDGKYKREEVDYAIAHQKEISPYLKNILRNVIKEPEKLIQNESYFGHIYALVLSGYFKDPTFHELIVKLFYLPEDLSDRIFGDFYSEYLHVALYQTCNGSLNEIKKLIMDKNVPDFNRIYAMSALMFAVIDGIMTRTELLKFLSALFTGDEADEDSEFWSYIACDICDLCPDEPTYEVIKQAYADGMIDEHIVDFEEFQEAIDLGVEESLNRLKNVMKTVMPDDIHQDMLEWACFKEDDCIPGQCNC